MASQALEARMIHVVTSDNRHLYASQLWEMFQIRKQHYIDERGWAELWRFGAAELDDSVSSASGPPTTTAFWSTSSPI